MVNDDTKEFRCPVHGYISIPKYLIKNFIDTDIFQRLRHIEQTSMRVLFPSAHHDRFSHSLGVFHLGNKAIKQFKKNVKNKIPTISSDLWEIYEFSFQIACLMHDCAHSPFSHTFEHFYDIENGKPESILDPIITSLINNPSFTEDYKKNASPAQHEIVSSIIFLKRFENIIKKDSRIDAELVVRMILGCLYYISDTDEKRIKNVIIKLLHSKTIDVDKLDYILRDTWSSGVNNISLDIDRLLNSLTITETKVKKIELGFKKSSLSIIKNVIEARNFLYLWIYGHHKVIYEQELMKNSINKLSEILNPKDPTDFLHQLFSVNSFFAPIEFSTHDGIIYIFLPVDGDIMYLIKKYRKIIETADEWLNRSHRKPIWKTFFEFHQYFGDLTEKERENLKDHSENTLNQLLKDNNSDGNFKTIEVKPKILNIERNMIFIDFEGKGIEFTTIPLIKQTLIEEYEKYFFYTYGPPDFIDNNKDKIIHTLKSLM